MAALEHLFKIVHNDICRFANHRFTSRYKFSIFDHMTFKMMAFVELNFLMIFVEVHLERELSDLFHCHSLSSIPVPSVNLLHVIGLIKQSHCSWEMETMIGSGSENKWFYLQYLTTAKEFLWHFILGDLFSKSVVFKSYIICFFLIIMMIKFVMSLAYNVKLVKLTQWKQKGRRQVAKETHRGCVWSPYQRSE